MTRGGRSRTASKTWAPAAPRRTPEPPPAAQLLHHVPSPRDLPRDRSRDRPPTMGPTTGPTLGPTTGPRDQGSRHVTDHVITH
eukprot:614906-Rhodomonas_salina.1